MLAILSRLPPSPSSSFHSTNTLQTPRFQILFDLSRFFLRPQIQLPHHSRRNRRRSLSPLVIRQILRHFLRLSLTNSLCSHRSACRNEVRESLHLLFFLRFRFDSFNFFQFPTSSRQRARDALLRFFHFFLFFLLRFRCWIISRHLILDMIPFEFDDTKRSMVLPIFHLTLFRAVAYDSAATAAIQRNSVHTLNHFPPCQTTFDLKQ